MKVDVVTYGGPLAGVDDEIARAAQQGVDGWFVSETIHDPFLTSVAAGLAARRLQPELTIGTAIALAFPRSPMSVAYAAHDLQALTGGRFVLGLGTQIKPHIEKRFSAVWSSPAARMREYVDALHAIWRAWETGERLAFRGEFYRHTLMTPFFTPEDHGYGPPPVWLAAVGPRMTEVAGEVADGLLCHSFTTVRYLEQVTLPRLAAGLAARGRTRADVEVVLPMFVVTGRDEAEQAAAAARVRGQIAFYGSTPAYKPVLELHGWEDLHDELHRCSKAGEWDMMATLIDDEVLEAFAVVAEPDDVGAAVRRRLSGLVDRVSLSGLDDLDEDAWRRIRTDAAGANTT